MWKNYLKIAFRSLVKNKLHTAINVSGLALGIASVFLMTSYVIYELGYDRYYEEHENLYRISWEDTNPQTRTPHPMAQAMVNDFPEVENAVSLSPLWGAGLTRRIFSVRNLEKDLRFDETNVLAVDSTFFDVFRIPIVRGNAENALKSINGLLISESTAKKYFGKEDPIGKFLAVNADTVLLEVMAVFKDVPDQSHFHFDLLVSYVREKSFDPDNDYYTWNDFGHFNYVRLKENSDAKVLEGKLMNWAKNHMDHVPEEVFQSLITNNLGFKLQPVSDIHLRSNLRWELEANGNIEYVYIMVAAALLTLLVSCINFMNLMTAKSAERAKEIGVRKTLGVLRSQLSLQFMSESLILTLISVVFAVLIIELSLPLYNSVTGQSATLDYMEAFPVLGGLIIIIGIGAAIFPSLYLSSAKPYDILKGKYQQSTNVKSLQKGLIVFQFAISMVLISGAIVIFNQLDYIRNKNLGFNTEEVLVIPLKERSVSGRMEALKSEILKIEGVNSVSASSNLPGGQYNQHTIFAADDPENRLNSSNAFVDYDFMKTLNIELVDGRFFLPENRADIEASFVLNEMAVQQLNLSEAVGSEIRWMAFGNEIKGKVIGVMKDFHFQSLHSPVQPLFFVLYPSYNHLIISVDIDNFEDKITNIKQVYSEFDDSFDFEYAFLDDQLNQQYKAESRTGLIFGLFTGIAIAIACFGLFGMAMITFNQRTKEVSVRKVLGASIVQLTVLLIGDFTRLILIAAVVATPLAWFIMEWWLGNFIYQVGIHPAVFLFSGLILIFIAWIALSYFTFKTIRVNPTETLKNE
ncbi:putative ABC transport system permease protein [Algoriphagus sp. 4150]|uniref:ABC transporter permease n=1 Tax=Algoriphagus sp. 4150 TaxID=2817756 RepID=UPI00285BA65C|nr:ABC transporter permease [Algoriphagus sp. 4150]MDR7132704.1 putative ABC transport system permease protein [Algoriphagus sp. 4150]